jgi:hypothetical protein
VTSSLPRGRVALPAGGLTPPNLPFPIAFVFVVNLEVQRGGVVEEKIDIQIQEIGDLMEQRLFDAFPVRFEKVHGPVQMMQL